MTIQDDLLKRLKSASYGDGMQSIHDLLDEAVIEITLLRNILKTLNSLKEYQDKMQKDIDMLAKYWDIILDHVYDYNIFKEDDHR